jgi:hypothetical protein
MSCLPAATAATTCHHTVSNDAQIEKTPESPTPLQILQNSMQGGAKTAAAVETVNKNFSVNSIKNERSVTYRDNDVSSSLSNFIGSTGELIFNCCSAVLVFFSSLTENIKSLFGSSNSEKIAVKSIVMDSNGQKPDPSEETSDAQLEELLPYMTPFN